MSLMFPAINPGQWSTTFPIKKTPVFSTIVQTPASGKGELRIPLYVIPRWQYEIDLSYAKGKISDPTSAIGQLLAFFLAVQGSAQDWLYDDALDDTVPSGAPVQFGTGDGTTRAFTINNGIQEFATGSPVIYINGTSTSAYGIYKGYITFTAAPAANAVLAWSGHFYYRCRFLEDQWPNLQQDMPTLWSATSIKFITVTN